MITKILGVQVYAGYPYPGTTNAVANVQGNHQSRQLLNGSRVLERTGVYCSSPRNDVNQLHYHSFCILVIPTDKDVTIDPTRKVAQELSAHDVEGVDISYSLRNHARRQLPRGSSPKAKSPSRSAAYSCFQRNGHVD